MLDITGAMRSFVKGVVNAHEASEVQKAPAVGTPDRSLRIGAVWCTLFDDPWTRGLRYLPLVHMWRGPSFFVSSTFRYGGGRIAIVRFDEDLRRDDLDGSRARIAGSVDLFYGASHGLFQNDEFSMALRGADWSPCVSGFDGAGPKIAVFETCYLVRCGQATCRRGTCNWRQGACAAVDGAWTGPNIGPTVRFVLGFASTASGDRTSTRRGWAFGENLFKHKMTISGAWLSAVQTTASAPDVGIAIALGDDDADANDLLTNADAHHALPPRTGSQIHVAWKTL